MIVGTLGKKTTSYGCKTDIQTSHKFLESPSTIALFDINLSSRYAAAYALHSFCQLNNECFSALILKLANRMSCVEKKMICSYDIIHPAYDATSTELKGVKIHGFLYPNFMQIPKKVSEKFLEDSDAH